MNREVRGLRDRAVVFDLDGTLIDSLADIASSFNHILSARGLVTHSAHAYRYFIGDGVLALARRALPPNIQDEGYIQECVEDYRQLYAREWNRRTRPYPGMLPLLERLQHWGVGLAVLSNKPHADTVKCVDEFFGAGRFAAVQGQTEEHPKKPDPGGALAIASQLGVEPGSCLLVGDSDVDMQTARAAGMVGIGVAWGFREVAELEESGAAAIVSEPHEIETLLESSAREE